MTAVLLSGPSVRVVSLTTSNKPRWWSLSLEISQERCVAEWNCVSIPKKNWEKLPQRGESGIYLVGNDSLEWRLFQHYGNQWKSQVCRLSPWLQHPKSPFPAWLESNKLSVISVNVSLSKDLLGTCFLVGQLKHAPYSSRQAKPAQKPSPSRGSAFFRLRISISMCSWHMSTGQLRQA